MNASSSSTRVTMKSSREARIQRIRMNEGLRISQQVADDNDDNGDGNTPRGRARVREPRGRLSPLSISSEPNRRESRMTNRGGIEDSPYSSGSAPSRGYPMINPDGTKEQGRLLASSIVTRAEDPSVAIQMDDSVSRRDTKTAHDIPAPRRTELVPLNQEGSVTSRLLRAIKAKNTPYRQRFPVASQSVRTEFQHLSSLPTDFPVCRHVSTSQDDIASRAQQTASERKHIVTSDLNTEVPSESQKDEFSMRNALVPSTQTTSRGKQLDVANWFPHSAHREPVVVIRPSDLPENKTPTIRLTKENADTAAPGLSPGLSSDFYPLQQLLSTPSNSPSELTRAGNQRSSKVETTISNGKGSAPHEMLQAATRGGKMYRFATSRASEPSAEGGAQGGGPSKNFQSDRDENIKQHHSPSSPNDAVRDRHVTFDLEKENEHRMSAPDLAQDKLRFPTKVTESQYDKQGGIATPHVQTSNTPLSTTASPSMLGTVIQRSETVSATSSITTPDRSFELGNGMAPGDADLEIESKGSSESLQHLLGSYPDTRAKSSQLIVASASHIEHISGEPGHTLHVSDAPDPSTTKSALRVGSSDSESTLSIHSGPENRKAAHAASALQVLPVVAKASKDAHDTSMMPSLVESPGSSWSSVSKGIIRMTSSHAGRISKGEVATAVTTPVRPVPRRAVKELDDTIQRFVDNKSLSSNSTDRIFRIRPNPAVAASRQSGAMTTSEKKDGNSTRQHTIDADNSISSQSTQMRRSATKAPSVATVQHSNVEPVGGAHWNSRTKSRESPVVSGHNRELHLDELLSVKPLFRITVVKDSPTDKIGVYVGKTLTNRGYVLVVSKISPTGPLVDSPMEVGDIVLSINGVDFQTNPVTSEASELVRDAKEKVTFILRRPDDDEVSPDLRLTSFPQDIASETASAGLGPRVRKESWDEDRSVVSLEEVDEDGSIKNRRVEKKTVNPDGSITMSMEEQSLSGSTFRVSCNESIHISGMMSVTVAKESREQKVGLHLATHDSSMGRVLLVASIDPTGLFAHTPLRDGDIILSVNGISFRRNPDTAIASSLIRNVEKDLTIVARKSERSLQDFLVNHGRNVSGIGQNAASPGKEATFEDSYGAVHGGYNSTLKVSVTKTDLSDRVGLTMVTRSSKLGTFLVVGDISPSGLLAKSALQVGDVILSINGVDVKKEPQLDRASSILRDAPDVVDIEYQRVLAWQPAVFPNEYRTKKTQVTQTILPDGQKVVKTETFNLDGTTTVKVEKFNPPRRVHVPLQRSNSDVSGTASLDMSEISGLDTASLDDAITRRRPELDGSGGIKWSSEMKGSPARSRADSDSGRPSHVFLPEVDVKSSKPNVLIVYKNSPSQEVGISLTIVRGSLRVTKVSPTGLFAGKPLLPGDVILSINSISFRDQPNVKTALILMDNAKKEIRIDVLHAATNDNAFQSKRRLWNPEQFFGTRRFKNSDKLKCWKGFRRSCTSKSPPRKRAETHTSPNTSFDEGYC